MLLWQPAGKAQTVAQAGAGDWALERIAELQAAAGHLCSAYSKCQLERSELQVHVVAQRWGDVERVAWRYTDWVRNLDADDPQLNMPPESITPEEPILCGERLRWWSIAFMVGTGVAPALRHTGGDGSRAEAELQRAVEALDQVCRSSATAAQADEACRLENGWNRFQLRRTLGYAAQGMVHLRRYDDGLRLFERIEELGDELQLEEHVWKAGASAGRGDVAGAAAQLRDLVVPRGQRRQVLDAFHRVPELTPLAEHAAVAPPLARWRGGTK